MEEKNEENNEKNNVFGYSIILVIFILIFFIAGIIIGQKNTVSIAYIWIGGTLILIFISLLKDILSELRKINNKIKK